VNQSGKGASSIQEVEGTEDGKSDAGTWTMRWFRGFLSLRVILNTIELAHPVALLTCRQESRVGTSPKEPGVMSRIFVAFLIPSRHMTK
jgi:hypothetical protein